MTPAPKRRWPRYTLRTLFVVVTVFGVWLAYEVNWIRQRHEVLTRCQWAYRFYEPVGYNEIPPRMGPRAPNLLGLFGEFGYGSIGLRFETDHARPNLTDAEKVEVKRVRRLFPEAEQVKGFAVVREPMPQKSVD
jgi:hypothetical protein